MVGARRLTPFWLLLGIPGDSNCDDDGDDNNDNNDDDDDDKAA
jgi:hypothetical protein